MSYTSQPSTSLLHSKVLASRGGTLSYTYEATVTGNTFAPSLEVEFWINGAQITNRTLFTDRYNTRTQDGADYDYTFDIDASEVVKDFFDDEQFFTSFGIYTDDDLRAELQLRIYEWIPNSDNIKTRSVSSTNSNTCTALNSIVTNLSDYNGADLLMTLTRPLNSYYVLGEEYYTSVFADTTNASHVRIRTYDKSDTLQGTIVVDILGGKSNGQICILSLLDIRIEGYTALNGGSVDISEAYYFTVDFGTWSSPTYTQNSDSRTFYVVTDAYRKLNFQWQNRFGTPESYTLYNSDWSTSKESERKTYRSQNGVTAYQVTTQETTIIELTNLSNELFEYLEEISESLVFYLDGVLHYADNFSIVTNDIENNNDIKITLKKSLEGITH